MESELARAMVLRALDSALPFAWVTADAAYGKKWDFRRTQELRLDRLPRPAHHRAQQPDHARLGINLNVHLAAGMRQFIAGRDWLTVYQLPSTHRISIRSKASGRCCGMDGCPTPSSPPPTTSFRPSGTAFALSSTAPTSSTDSSPEPEYHSHQRQPEFKLSSAPPSLQLQKPLSSPDTLLSSVPISAAIPKDRSWSVQ